jgi:hypothetical protein
MNFRIFCFIFLLAFISTSLYAGMINTSQCILFDSSSTIKTNPRQIEIDSCIALWDKAASKENNISLFSDLPIFYAILPETKDTLTISQYIAHFNNLDAQSASAIFLVSVNWDSKIYSVVGYCTALEKDSDKDFWMAFWNNVHVSHPAKINNIPSQISTNIK